MINRIVAVGLTILWFAYLYDIDVIDFCLMIADSIEENVEAYSMILVAGWLAIMSFTPLTEEEETNV